MTDLSSEEMLSRILQALRENSRHFAALRKKERAATKKAASGKAGDAARRGTSKRGARSRS